MFQEQAPETTRQKIQLWSRLHNRGLDSAALRFRKKCQSSLFENEWQTDSQNILRFQFAVQEHQQILELAKRDQEPKLQEVNDSLDRLYYYEKLKHYSKSLIQQKFTSKQYDFPLIDEILERAKAPKYQSLYGLQFFASAIQALRSDHDPAYFEMKKILFQQVNLLDRTELPYMLLLSRNYCIQRLNDRERSFTSELFEIYQLEIDQDLIRVKGRIPAATYKNIATLSLLLRRFDWLEQFLHEYRDAVDEGSYYFNLGVLRFTQSRYEEADELFLKTGFQEVLMDLSVKTWQLKTHFELWLKYPDDFGYDERLEAHITAFTTFLNRKKARLPKHYLYHLNFGKFVRELLRRSRPYQRDPEELSELLKRVRAVEQLSDRAWLVEKLHEML